MICHPEYGTVKNIFLVLVNDKKKAQKLMVLEPEKKEQFVIMETPMGWGDTINPQDNNALFLIVNSYLDLRYSNYPLMKNREIYIAPGEILEDGLELTVAIKYNLE